MKRNATRKKRLPSNTAAEGAQSQAGINADPDACELTARELPHMRPFCELVSERHRRRPRSTRRKIPVVLRLDRHILNFFRSNDADWQSRVNAALAEYVRRHRSG